MTDRSFDSENEGFWSDSVESIALEFEIPRATAASLEQNIGDIESIKDTLGRYGPDDYLELIRRREWIPHEREDLEKEWTRPLKRWCTRRAKGVYLVHESEKEEFRNDHKQVGMQSINLGSGWRAVALKDGSTKRSEVDALSEIGWTSEMAALRKELERKEEWVKYEMRRVDPEWIGLTKELKKIEDQLVEIYQSHIEEDDRDFQYKKDEIIELKQAFPYLRANADLVGEATDSSLSYVNKFKYIPGKGVANRRVKGKLRDEVIERDGNVCVSCGQEEDLQVHHIIPHGQGGKNEKDNLATLCSECHYYAHGGGQAIEDGRYTAATWDSVEYDDRAEFWDKWIHQSFEDRAAKGFTHANFQFKE